MCIQRKTGNIPSDICYKCGRSGHYATDCYAKSTVYGEYINDSSDDELSDDEECCFKCGWSGHYASQCYTKKKNCLIYRYNDY